MLAGTQIRENTPLTRGRSLTRFQGDTQQDNGLYLAIPARPQKGSPSKQGRKEDYESPKILNKSSFVVG